MLYIQRALSPAKLKSIEIDEENKKVKILVDKTQASLRSGGTVRMFALHPSSPATKIKVEQEGAEEEYDIELVQFREELTIFIRAAR